MFRFLPALAGCLLLWAPDAARAQDWATKMFTETRHDFGKVARNAKVEHHFTFKNIYVEDLHVAGVRTSCGCTTPRVTQDTLKTYDEAAIVAHFNTDQFLGQRSATLTVIFDKPFYAEVQLHVAGYIRSDVVLSPAGIDFAAVEPGQTAERQIEIQYAGRSDWRIRGVKSSSSFIEAEVVEGNRVGNRVQYSLTVRLKPGAPAGFLKEQVFLQTSDSLAPELPVDVEGRISAALTVSPGSLFLGILQPGQKVTKQIVVQGKRAFKITSVTASDSCFEFKTNDDAKVVHLVPVVFTAGNQGGNVNYRVRIETDLGADAVGEIAAYAQINAPTTTARAGPAALP